MLAMLSDRVIRELRNEACRLRRRADLIDEFLRGARDGREAHVSPPMLPQTPSYGSFAANVRKALAKIGGTATSREVAQYMIDMGEPPEKNRKPLRNTVAVELFRMSKKGTGGVKRISRGCYEIETREPPTD